MEQAQVRTLKHVSQMRRNLLIGTAGVSLAAGLPAFSIAAQAGKSTAIHQSLGSAQTMNFITTKDGTQIYFKDWGTGQPIVFSHGWPLTADAFEDQMFFLASRGYRCIAHDRQRHGYVCR
jgi:non-heme chloroperoxidase